MAERLRRKAELQQQASKTTSYKESLANELKKNEQRRAQTKEERRNALCEELGRGC